MMNIMMVSIKAWSKPHKVIRASSCLLLNKVQNGLDNGCCSAWQRILPFLLLTLSTVKLSLNDDVLFTGGQHISRILFDLQKELFEISSNSVLSQCLPLKLHIRAIVSNLFLEEVVLIHVKYQIIQAATQMRYINIDCVSHGLLDVQHVVSSQQQNQILRLRCQENYGYLGLNDKYKQILANPIQYSHKKKYNLEV